MIPRDFITEWRAEAPWVQDIQVEQDLVISRALCEIFSNPVLRQALAFRGGTALYKLFLRPAARYSEDIDLVQMRAEPAGPVMEALRATLDPWLGAPRWKQTEGRVTFSYRFDSEETPAIPMRLKIEINTREHFAVKGFQTFPFAVASRWYNGACEIPTYHLDELLGTKVRALYQRRKGRDLFDLEVALASGLLDPAEVTRCFSIYMTEGGHAVTRAQFEANLAAKLNDGQFTTDIGPLLRTGYDWNAARAYEVVMREIVARLP